MISSGRAPFSCPETAAGRARGDTGRRSYDDTAVSVAATIHAMFELGFTRDEVRAMLPCAIGQRDHGDEDLLERVEDIRDRVDDRIRVLPGARDALTAFLRPTAHTDAKTGLGRSTKRRVNNSRAVTHLSRRERS